MMKNNYVADDKYCVGGHQNQVAEQRKKRTPDT